MKVVSRILCLRICDLLFLFPCILFSDGYDIFGFVLSFCNFVFLKFFFAFVSEHQIYVNFFGTVNSVAGWTQGLMCKRGNTTLAGLSVSLMYMREAYCRQVRATFFLGNVKPKKILA